MVEKRLNKYWFRLLEVALIPIVLLFIQLGNNNKLEREKLAFSEKLEREKLTFSKEMEEKKIAFATLPKLFSDNTCIAANADKLISHNLTPQIKNQLSEIIAQRHVPKVEEKIIEGRFNEVEEIIAIGGPASIAIRNKLEKKQYYVVASSLNLNNKSDAIKLAHVLQAKGYTSSVYRSVNGHLAVTIGYLPYTSAMELRAQAIKKKELSKDIYLLPKERLGQRIFPE